MVTSGILPDLLFLLGKYLGYVLGLLHVVHLAVGCHQQIVLSRAERLQHHLVAKVLLAAEYLVAAAIQLHAVLATIAQHVGITQTVFGVVHVSVAVHLKPVYVLLLGQTQYVALGCQHGQLLLVEVKTHLHIVVYHAVVAYATLIHVGVVFVVGAVFPRPHLVLWFNLSHIQAGKIRSRGEVLLSFCSLYARYYTG